MSTQSVANRLVEMCRNGKYMEAQAELYSPKAVSIEPAGAPAERVEGLDALKAKAEEWEAMVEEVHSASVSDPLVAGSFFSCTMINDITFKEMGRQQIQEVCVYEVKDDKIVKEQFFYDMQPPEA